jgi:hypothetical protein
MDIYPIQDILIVGSLAGNLTTASSDIDVVILAPHMKISKKQISKNLIGGKLETVHNILKDFENTEHKKLSFFIDSVGKTERICKNTTVPAYSIIYNQPASKYNPDYYWYGSCWPQTDGSLRIIHKTNQSLLNLLDSVDINKLYKNTINGPVKI